MDGEGGAVGCGGVAAEENELVDVLAGGRLPAAVEVVLLDDAPLVFQQAHRPVREALQPGLHFPREDPNQETPSMHESKRTR